MEDEKVEEEKSAEADETADEAEEEETA